MKQMTLWDVESDTKYKKNNSDLTPIGEDLNEEMKPCVFCGVMPRVWKHKLPTHSTYTNAKCPVCGYHCATPYDIADHWNKLQGWRARDGK